MVDGTVKEYLTYSILEYDFEDHYGTKLAFLYRQFAITHTFFLRVSFGLKDFVFLNIAFEDFIEWTLLSCRILKLKACWFVWCWDPSIRVFFNYIVRFVFLFLGKQVGLWITKQGVVCAEETLACCWLELKQATS